MRRRMLLAAIALTIAAGFAVGLTPQRALAWGTPPGSHTHVVVRGDTLWDIARANHITLTTLERANRQIRNFNLIFPGQRITVPGVSSGGVVRVSRPSAPPPPASEGSVADLIRDVFGRFAPQALVVARCESGLNPSEVNLTSGFHEDGVFQFTHSTWAETPWHASNPLNASANVHAAFWLFSRDGFSWREWTCGRISGFR